MSSKKKKKRKKKGSRLTHCPQTVSDYKEANASLSLSHTFHHRKERYEPLCANFYGALIDRWIDGNEMFYILNFYYFKSFEF